MKIQLEGHVENWKMSRIFLVIPPPPSPHRHLHLPSHYAKPPLGLLAAVSLNSACRMRSQSFSQLLTLRVVLATPLKLWHCVYQSFHFIIMALGCSHLWARKKKTPRWYFFASGFTTWSAVTLLYTPSCGRLTKTSFPLNWLKELPLWKPPVVVFLISGFLLHRGDKLMTSASFWASSVELVERSLLSKMRSMGIHCGSLKPTWLLSVIWVGYAFWVWTSPFHLPRQAI